MHVSFEKVQQLKNHVDDIRAALKGFEKEIPIPTIVVIGDQSSGKSSLLELLSSVDIPRSDGICTRVPLELRLRSSHNESQSAKHSQEHAIISTIKDGTETIEEHISIDAVSSKIEEYTKYVAGDTKTIAEQPITLTIYRNDFVDLTLIDLPGLVHFDKKDKHKSAMIKNVVQKYITNPQTLILNVVKCTNETANCASLQMSSEHDPNGDRTLLVLTFIDLLEDSKSFEDKYKTFQQDFQEVFIVKNRTNEENTKNVTLKDIQIAETEFFDRAANMKNIDSSYKGSKQLSHKLAELQTNTMLRALPGLQRAINDKFKQLNKEKEGFPKMFDTAHECMNEVSIFISELFVKLNEIKTGDCDFDGDIVIEGTNTNNTNNNKNNTNGICDVVEYFKQFAKKIRTLHSKSEFFSATFVKKLTKMNVYSQGFCSLPNEIHPNISVRAIRSLIEGLEKPTFALVDKVHLFIEERVAEQIEEICGDYKLLQRELKHAFHAMLDSCKQTAITFVSGIIRAEKKKPWTTNHYYMTTVQKGEKIINTATQPSQNKTFVKINSIVVSGVTGSNAVINGEYSVRKEKYKGKDWFSKGINFVYWREGIWYIGKSKKEFYVKSEGDTNSNYSIDEVEQWLVHKGNDNEFVVDTNIEVIGIPEVFNELKEEFGGTIWNDIEHKSNTEIIIIKECIKICAYWQVLTKRFIDYIPMLIWDNLVDIPFESKTQKEIQRVVLLRNKDISSLMCLDKELTRKVRRNQSNLQQIQNAKQILEKIDRHFLY